MPTKTIITSLLAILLTTISPAEEELPPHILKLQKTLQEMQGELTKVEVNTKKADIDFKALEFKGKTFKVGEKEYYAFRFTAPKQGGDFVWSFRMPEGCLAWYIVAAKGEMDGFTRFFNRYIREDIPDICEKGDLFIYQTLPGRNFTPGSDYIIWINIREGGSTTLPLSLNFLSDDQKGTEEDLFPLLSPRPVR